MSRLRFAPLSLFASQAEFWKIPKKLFGLTSFSDCTICFAQSSGITKMRPTLRAMSGMPEPKHYIGWWGDMGGPKQKGIVQYSLSPYQQRAMKGVFSGYLFNGFSRLAGQMPYWIVPFAIAYGTYTWGSNKYAYYNSKEGHHAMAQAGSH
ncbi:MAG: ubiquinol--cytochrome-c reductase subunit 8 [Tremellales sp. Tagirdzhanova-0007]|nr:MAG: ubiquinol--cytochrome-c reductase subunit 8 [Tremellales sp. Tagirdzhanova-0007]